MRLAQRFLAQLQQRDPETIRRTLLHLMALFDDTTKLRHLSKVSVFHVFLPEVFREWSLLRGMRIPHPVKSIAHRGLSGFYADNTLDSIQAAMCARVDYVELDVILVGADVYVAHDSRFPGALPPNQLRLDRVLEVVGGYPLMVELKGYENRDDLPDAVTALLAKHGHGNCLLASFNEHYVGRLAATRASTAVPPYQLGLIVDATNAAEVVAKSRTYRLDVVVNNCESVAQSFVDTLHAHDIPLYCYTVNHKYLCDELVAMGVDGIISNYANHHVFLCNA